MKLTLQKIFSLLLLLLLLSSLLVCTYWQKYGKRKIIEYFENLSQMAIVHLGSMVVVFLYAIYRNEHLKLWLRHLLRRRLITHVADFLSVHVSYKRFVGMNGFLAWSFFFVRIFMPSTHCTYNSNKFKWNLSLESSVDFTVFFFNFDFSFILLIDEKAFDDYFTFFYFSVVSPFLLHSLLLWLLLWRFWSEIFQYVSLWSKDSCMVKLLADHNDG